MNARRFVVVLLTLLMAGCSNSPTAPAAPTVPSVLGVYSRARWLTLTLTVVSSGQEVTGACGGSMTISSQTGSSFSGSFIRRGCTAQGTQLDQSIISGNVVNGVVRADGGVSFDLRVPG